MRDRLIDLLWCIGREYDEYCDDSHEVGLSPMESFEEMAADHLLSNGVIVLPCKVGTTVYVIEPKWYGVWGEDEHECRRCEHFYEGGMGDPPDCSLGKNCCYKICEEEADLRHLADWITPNGFTGKIEWGKTVFLTREEAEKALAERSEG